jgi:hypothetical protein
MPTTSETIKCKWNLKIKNNKNLTPFNKLGLHNITSNGSYGFQ